MITNRTPKARKKSRPGARWRVAAGRATPEDPKPVLSRKRTQGAQSETQAPAFMARLGGLKARYSRNEAEQTQHGMGERHQSDKGQDMQQGEERSAVRHTGNQQQGPAEQAEGKPTKATHHTGSARANPAPPSRA